MTVAFFSYKLWVVLGNFFDCFFFMSSRQYTLLFFRDFLIGVADTVFFCCSKMLR